MNINFNGAALQSYRTSIVGVLWFLSTIAIAIAGAATDHPTLQFWAVMVSAGAGLLLGILSADHARVKTEIERAMATIEARRQADAIKGPQTPTDPQNTIPELSPPGREPQ